jgi:hypothetical protein
MPRTTKLLFALTTYSGTAKTCGFGWLLSLLFRLLTTPTTTIFGVGLLLLLLLGFLCCSFYIEYLQSLRPQIVVWEWLLLWFGNGVCCAFWDVAVFWIGYLQSVW